MRELENAIERAVVLSSGELLDLDLLPPAVRSNNGGSALAASAAALPDAGVSFWDAVSAYERQLIVRALQSAGGVQKRAAEILRVKPTTLHEMMKRLAINAETLNS